MHRALSCLLRCGFEKQETRCCVHCLRDILPFGFPISVICSWCWRKREKLFSKSTAGNDIITKKMISDIYQKTILCGVRGLSCWFCSRKPKPVRNTTHFIVSHTPWTQHGLHRSVKQTAMRGCGRQLQLLICPVRFQKRHPHWTQVIKFPLVHTENFTCSGLIWQWGWINVGRMKGWRGKLNKLFCFFLFPLNYFSSSHFIFSL